MDTSGEQDEPLSSTGQCASYTFVLTVSNILIVRRHKTPHDQMICSSKNCPFMLGTTQTLCTTQVAVMPRHAMIPHAITEMHIKAPLKHSCT